MNVSGVAAVAQKLFLTAFWRRLGAGDPGLPFSPQALSIGWLTGGALNGSDPPPGQVVLNLVCARPQVIVSDIAVSHVAVRESMRVIPPAAIVSENRG